VNPAERVLDDYLSGRPPFDGGGVLEWLAAAGYAVVPQRDTDPAPHHWAERYAEVKRERDEAVDAAARLRELCGFLIDACAEHGIPVPLNSSLLDLAADIASDGGAGAVGSVGSVDPEGERCLCNPKPIAGQTHSPACRFRLRHSPDRGDR
jgi:hypothetical protein